MAPVTSAAAKTARVVRRSVAIGVTGHRLNQLPEADIPRLRHLLESTLDATAGAARTAAQGDVRMILVSALAEGTDRFAAHAALARSWRLVAPLPFKVARYLEDFETAQSRSEFMDLLDRSSAVEPDGEGSYLAVGEMILDRADVLVALWNGAPPKGAGGTGDVAARALLRGTPVLWIPVSHAPVHLVLPARAPRADTFRARLAAALANAFQTAPRPAAMQLAEA